MVCALTLLVTAIRTEKMPFFLAAGISAALSVYSKQNIGAGATIGSIILILLQPIEWKSKFKAVSLFVVGLAIPTVIFLAYLIANHALMNAFDWIVVRAYSKAGMGYFEQIFSIVSRPNHNFIKFAVIL